ncbi:hypothetical protein AAGW04_18090 [Pectobacterium aroidearum]|uniref:hypothetical protein n=1 Tax=Pectobacterium aroidearum TaxID=1201031 RepID=UPI00315928B7
MYDAIMVRFKEHRFLVPERGFSYFPTEFETHRAQIERIAIAYDKLIVSLANPFSADADTAAIEIKQARAELADFILLTGVIGAPFDSKDAGLYAAANKISIQMEIDF